MAVEQFNRKFFLARTAALALLATGVLGEPAVNALLYTPGKQPVPKESGDFTLYPGWMETNITSPLIQADQGHFAWLREAVFANPLVQGLTKVFFNYLEGQRDNNRRLTMGEALSHTIGQAAQSLDQIARDKISPQTNMSLETVHLGVTVLAAGFITWFNPAQLKTLGISLTGFRSVSDYFWNRKKGLGTIVFPRLFGLDESQLGSMPNIGDEEEPRFTGEDRSLHFSQHLLLGIEYFYSRFFHLGEHDSIPFVLKLLMSFGQTEADRARILSDKTGYFYELSSLRNRKNWPIPFVRWSNVIGEGIFDSMVKADYKGNRLGVETAIELWHRTASGLSIAPVMDELTNPKFTNIRTSPALVLSTDCQKLLSCDKF